MAFLSVSTLLAAIVTAAPADITGPSVNAAATGGGPAHVIDVRTENPLQIGLRHGRGPHLSAGG